MTESQVKPNLGAYNEDESSEPVEPSVGPGGSGAAGESGATAGANPTDAADTPPAEGAEIDPGNVKEALKAVVDPEIGLDIVNLGLIYDVAVNDNNIKVEMTLTGPGCPIGPMLQSQVYGVCAGFPGARNVQVDLVWSPPWDPRTMASEEAKDILGIW